MAVTQFSATSGVTIDGVTITNGVVDVDGTDGAFVLDADGDTKISANSDDDIEFLIGGAVDFNMTSNALTAATGSKFAGQGSTIAMMIPAVAQQAISGAGQITVTEYYTAVTTTGSNALTLADGSAVGQMKKIQMIVDAGDGTLTPTNLSGGTTITFADVGDTAELMFDGTNWVAVALYNVVDGATAPVLA